MPAFDIQPSGPRRSAPTPRPAARQTPAPTPPARSAPERIILTPRGKPTRRESGRAATPRASDARPLKQRRRAAKKRVLWVILLAILVLFVAVEALLWQPFLRVESVQADGPEADTLQAFVLADLHGTRFGIVPKNSIFFIPQKQLRDDTLAKFPEIEAVSFTPSGLTGLSVHATERAVLFWWCGETPDMKSDVCYQTDAKGFIFAPVPLDQRYASTSILILYAPLQSGSVSSPQGASIAKGDTVAGLLQFVKAMRSLGANIVSVALRGDEADLYTEAGTRITYVLGREEQAAALASSGMSDLNVNDGSLLYVDLRFSDKIYFKKK